MSVRNPKSTHRGRRPRAPYSMIGSLIALIVIAFVVYRCVARHSGDTTYSSYRPELRADSTFLDVYIPEGTPQQMVSYPGFIVSFNPVHHQPNYSAWIVSRATLGGEARRTDKFYSDPEVNGCATLEDYRGSGYDRGHMAPAGDMTWSDDAMAASFSLANISPQHKQLNQKAWKKLEENTRKWADRDSLIVVVCGPVLTDRIAETIGESHVTVPQRYFKVLLAPYANPPRAIGFIMNNGYVEGGMQQSAVSVDEVEAITGYDFFHTLPDTIENDIEHNYKFSKWSYTR